MNRRRFLAVASGATTAGIAGCFGDGGPPEVNEEDIAFTIGVERRSFEPNRASIEAGEAVQWRNDRADFRAEVVSTSGVGDSWDFDETIAPGETTAYLFEDPGVYAFHDRTQRRSIVCGAVLVGDRTEDDVPNLPCEG